MIHFLLEILSIQILIVIFKNVISILIKIFIKYFLNQIFKTKFNLIQLSIFFLKCLFFKIKNIIFIILLTIYLNIIISI